MYPSLMSFTLMHCRITSTISAREMGILIRIASAHRHSRSMCRSHLKIFDR